MKELKAMIPPEDPELNKLYEGILAVLKDYGVAHTTRPLFTMLIGQKSLEEEEQEHTRSRDGRELTSLIKNFYEDKEKIYEKASLITITLRTGESLSVKPKEAILSMLEALERHFHTLENWKDWNEHTERFDKVLSDKEFSDYSKLALNEFIGKASARPRHLKSAVIRIFVPLKELLSNASNETMAEVTLRLLALKKYFLRSSDQGRRIYDFTDYNPSKPSAREDMRSPIKTVREIIEDYNKRGSAALHS